MRLLNIIRYLNKQIRLFQLFVSMKMPSSLYFLKTIFIHDTYTKQLRFCFIFPCLYQHSTNTPTIIFRNFLHLKKNIVDNKTKELWQTKFFGKCLKDFLLLFLLLKGFYGEMRRKEVFEWCCNGMEGECGIVTSCVLGYCKFLVWFGRVRLGKQM